MKVHRLILVLVAVAALAAGMFGGQAVAAVETLITGKQIKDGSIGLVDLSSKAKKSLRGQTGTRGPTGPAGQVGPVGPAGANGGFDPSKVIYVEGSSVNSKDGNTHTAVATCPPGMKVIGGGYFVGSHTGPVSVVESRARDASGWYVSVSSTQYVYLYETPTNGKPAGTPVSAYSSADFYATAVCAAP